MQGIPWYPKILKFLSSRPTPHQCFTQPSTNILPPPQINKQVNKQIKILIFQKPQLSLDPNIMFLCIHIYAMLILIDVQYLQRVVFSITKG